MYEPVYKLGTYCRLSVDISKADSFFTRISHISKGISSALTVCGSDSDVNTASSAVRQNVFDRSFITYYGVVVMLVSVDILATHCRAACLLICCLSEFKESF